jgi:hypothetical protein
VVDSLGVHLSTCKHLGGAIVRHDKVVGVVEQLACAAGVVARKEVTGALLRGNKRLDMLFPELSPAGRDVVIDVKVMDPRAEGHVAHAAANPLGTALKGEREKVRKYGVLCSEAGMDFVPTVWESFGAAAPTTRSFFSQLVGCIDRAEFSPPNWAASSPAAYWLQRLAVTLQRYNAAKILHLASTSLSHHRTLHPPPLPA